MRLLFNTDSSSRARFLRPLALNYNIKSELSVTDLLSLFLFINCRGAW